ncbi:ribosomal RNA processing protein 36 homolog [Dunckerocampus dactyliophorus]|uniref:ribosomal RNA processing protein 36 homolog n=1 Tax=Dunckerocampus dactyliophorus TaxID=161453 RepID=UPI002406EE8E|nr:ribosomal RNA processing protein 36 homolog [Dunckerocampus dactyliophorus]
MKRAEKTAKNATSSSDEEDSDVEKNFALLMERGAEKVGECSEDEERDVDGSDHVEEEESEDEDDNEESAIQTRDDIKKELSNMSFEEVMKLQNEVGTKAYQEVAYGATKRQQSAKHKRLNKNRPMEMSSKKAAPFLRQVVAVKKATLRDPRFDDLSGEYKADIFERTYDFIHDIRRREAQVIQKELKKTKNNDKKEKLHFLLKKMANQEQARLSREKQRERELQFKKEQREQANKGARPFFLKKCDQKKVRLAERYHQLKKSGKLEKFLSKKRKRNALKDRRKLPQQQHNKQGKTQ